MLEFIKRHRKILYITGLVICAALFAVLGKKSIKTNKIGNKVYSIHAHCDRKSDLIYYQRLIKGDEIRQTFTADTKIDGISFCFHRVNDSPIKGQTFIAIRIANTGEVVYEDIYNNAMLPADKLVDFGLHDASLETGREYELILTSDAEREEDALQIYLQNAGAYNGRLVVNNVEIKDRSLCFGTFKHSNLPNKIFNFVLVLSILVLAAVLISAYVVRLPLHQVFIAACIGFGGIYMLIVAPGKGCDSAHHFRAAYNYSNIMLLQGSASDGLYMRADDYEFYKRNFEIEDGYYGLMSADAFMDLKDTASFLIHDSNMINTGIGVSESGSFIPYIPYALGLWLGRLLHLGALPTVYIARFLGLVVFALMISFAIKIIPVGKEMLALTALMPMTLHEYSAFSYDGMCIAAAFLFTACWLKCMHGGGVQAESAKAGVQAEKQDGRKGSMPGALQDRTFMAVWIISAILLGACKNGTYIFFALLLIAVKKVHMSFKKKLAVAGSMTASALIFNIVRFAIVAAEAFGLVILASDGKYMPGSDYTLSYAVEHPWQFLLMCIGSLIEKADYYVGSTVGTHLSANIQTVPLAAVLPFIVIILLVSFESEDNKNSADRLIITANEKLAMAVSFLASCFVMFFMMQVSTPVGWNIDGVTGRYFLPILPLVFLCLYGNGITISEKMKNRAITLFYCWHIVEIFYAVWGVVIR